MELRFFAGIYHPQGRKIRRRYRDCTYECRKGTGRIKEIKLFGDFFGNGDIAELEETLQGLPLDEHLEDNLQKIHIDEYMKGIRVEELAALLRD